MRRIAGRIEAVLKILDRGDQLAVDANGRFDVETAIAYAKALAPYGLHWYEEAGDPLDYELQSKLAEHYPNPMATGENLFSMQDARNLIRYGGMRSDRDILQFDCALSYGLVEYLRTLDMLKQYGWSSRRCIPHGGHQLSLNIAAGLGLGGNESYPGNFSAIRRIRGRHSRGKQLREAAGDSGNRVRGEERIVQSDGCAGKRVEL